MVGKATAIEARSCGDPRNATTAAIGGKQTVPESAGPQCHRSHTGREGGSTDRRLSSLLVVFLVLVSLIALYEVAQLPDPSSDANRSSSSIRTIRSFYAGLNAYMATGDAGTVSEHLAPGAWSVVPDHGILGDDSGLLTYLIALRSDQPQLRFTVDQIDADDAIAIANVRISGATGTPVLGWPPASGTSQEFFRVRDGRIVEHWTTAPESVLLHSLTTPPIRVELIQPSHLAIAELSFSPGKQDPLAIDGPAFVIIQRGRLTLSGNGPSQILDIETGATTVPGEHERVSVGPGQAISIPEYRALVQNNEPEVANVLLATLIDDPRQVQENVPGERHPPPTAINDPALIGAQNATTYDGVTVRPLVFDNRSIPTGPWEMEIAWAVLGPGASLALATDGFAIAYVKSDAPSNSSLGQHNAGIVNALTNDTSTPVVALVIRLRAPH